jgi:hypothetical protein
VPLVNARGEAAVIAVDGIRARGVREYDVEEGYCIVLCRDEDHDEGGQPHLVPGSTTTVCEVILDGEVEVLWGERIR